MLPSVSVRSNLLVMMVKYGVQLQAVLIITVSFMSSGSRVVTEDNQGQGAEGAAWLGPPPTRYLTLGN